MTSGAGWYGGANRRGALAGAGTGGRTHPLMGDDVLGVIGGGMAIALFIWHSRNTGHSFLVYWAPFLGGNAMTWLFARCNRPIGCTDTGLAAQSPGLG